MADNPQALSKLGLGDIAKFVGNTLLPGSPFGGAPSQSLVSLDEVLDAVGLGDDEVDVGQGASQPGVNSMGCPIYVTPRQETRLRAPRGYVIVTENGVKKAMLKEAARSCGLWKPNPKPVMTASDAKTLKKAARLQAKVDRVAKMANAVCSKAPLRRTRGKR
jgi:hypothetical protein